MGAARGELAALALGSRATPSSDGAVPNAEGWDARAAGLDHPFLLTSWLGPWLDAFAPSAELVTQMWEPGLGAPLLWARPGVACAAANVHTPISGSLAGDSPDVAEAVPKAIRRVVWPSLAAHEAEALAVAFRRSEWLTVTERQHLSPVAQTEDSFAAYERRLGRSLRQRSRRLERKLAHESGARLVMTSATKDPALFDRCLELEAAGWKGRAGTAILSQPRTEMFYRAIARLPNARLLALNSPAGVLAFSLCVEHSSRLYLLKTAYDERHRTTSPGLVVQYATIRACHDEGLTAYEMLGKADRWKLQFANAGRPIARVIADRRTVLGYAHHRVRLARPVAKLARTTFRQLRG